MEYPFSPSLGQNISSKVLAKGSVSWQVLDSKEAVRLEISSIMQSLMNTGANRSAIPKHLYHLTMQPRTISVILQWSSDLVEKGFNLAFPGATQMGKINRTLKELAPDQCADVEQKADLFSEKSTSVDIQNFITALSKLAKAVKDSSLAAFRVDAWTKYFRSRLAAAGFK